MKQNVNNEDEKHACPMHCEGEGVCMSEIIFNQYKG